MTDNPTGNLSKADKYAAPRRGTVVNLLFLKNFGLKRPLFCREKQGISKLSKPKNATKFEYLWEKSTCHYIDTHRYMKASVNDSLINTCPENGPSVDAFCQRVFVINLPLPGKEHDAVSDNYQSLGMQALTSCLAANSGLGLAGMSVKSMSNWDNAGAAHEKSLAKGASLARPF
jgi:hypothetical protein